MKIFADLLFSLGVTIETGVVLIAIYMAIQKLDFTRIEAFCVSFFLTIALYSTVAQTLFIFRIPNLSWIVDILFSTSSLYFLFLNRVALKENLQFLIKIKERVSFWFLFPVLFFGLYLFAQAWFLPPSSYDAMGYNLARVLLFQETGTLRPDNFNFIHQIIHAPGYEILQFWFLRGYSDFGLGLFNIMSLFVILSGTFSLVEQEFQNRQLAQTVALIVASFTLLIVQGASVKNDIPLSALAVTNLLIGRKFLSKPNSFALYFMALSLLLGMSIKAYFPFFQIPFLILLTVAALYRHGWKPLVSEIRPEMTVTGLFPGAVAVLVTGCLFIHMRANFYAFGNFFGDQEAVQSHGNPDGLSGALANSVRYVIQIISWPGAGFFDRLFQRFFPGDQGLTLYKGISLTPALSDLFPSEEKSWFGFTGALLVIPAIFFSLLRGTAFVRVATATLLFFFLLICYVFSWSPFAGRYFSLFFASTGLSLAFLLENPLNRWKKTTVLLRMAAWLWISFSVFFAMPRPILNSYEITWSILKRYGKENLASFRIKQAGLSYPGPLFFNWIYYCFDRDAFTRIHFFAEVIEPFSRMIPENANVLFLANPGNWVFPFLLRRPDVHFTLQSPDHLGKFIQADGKKIHNFRYILFVGAQPPPQLSEFKKIFSVEENLSGETPVVIFDTETENFVK